MKIEKQPKKGYLPYDPEKKRWASFLGMRRLLYHRSSPDAICVPVIMNGIRLLRGNPVDRRSCIESDDDVCKWEVEDQAVDHGKQHG